MNEFNNYDEQFEVVDDTEKAPIQFDDGDEPPKRKGRGFKIFIACISLTVALCIAVSCGYLAGQYSGGSEIELFGKPDKKLSAENIYKTVNKSVVGIVIYNNTGIKGYASGVIYSADGYIVSNDHIYEDVPDAKFKIYTADGKIYDGKFIAGDTRSDLSVIKVNASALTPAVFGNSGESVCGEEVLAIGRPRDAAANSSVTKGIISYVNRRVRNSTNYSEKLIETDSPINPGSSGGALVNMYGQVIGITSSKLVGEDYDSVGYAIPSATVKFVIESLIKNGKVVGRSRLGITYKEFDSATASIAGSKYFGLKIAEIQKESDLYGNVKVDDIITHVNDVAIVNDDVILDVIEANKPGTVITLTVVSGNKAPKKFKCKLLSYVGGSSYVSSSGELTPDGESSSDKTFDFPYGN